MIKALACTFLLCLCIGVGGCSKSHKGGTFSAQKVCAVEMRVAETGGGHEDSDWSFDMDKCVLTLDKKEKDE